MATRSTDQITLVDLTDGVSVVLSSESYSFPGTTTAAIAGSTTTKVQALMGATYVAASVNVANVTKPAGVTVTSDNHATAPTLTIAVASTVTAPGEVIIPVVVDGITVEKRFSYSIAFKGATGSQGPTGNTGSPGVNAILTGLKNEASAIVTNSSGVTTSAQTISVDFYAWQGTSRIAATAAVTGLPSGVTVGTNTAATASADGVLSLVFANGSNLGGGDAGNIVVTVTAGGQARTHYFSWSKAKAGAQGATGSTGSTGAPGAPGADGADAITVEVVSSDGLIFKNTGVSTTLTAKVYQGGVELSSAQVTPLGTISWYKNGGATAVGTGLTLAVSAADVVDRATYEARLEY